MLLEYDAGPLAPVVPRTTLGSKFGTIIYASRTHSQLSQVVSELRRTSYSPKISVLGSREQLCINERLSSQKGSALNHNCNVMNAQRKCFYKNNLDLYKDVAPSLLDIEQLVSLGKKDKICPYFFSREVSTTAEMILLPYNYLMDASIRISLKIDWKNSIVIFDEAHNLERVAADAASISISSTEIAQCIAELQQVLRLLQLIGESKEAPANSKKGSDGNNVDLPKISVAMRLLSALFEFEKRIDAVPLSTSGGYNREKSSKMPGSWLVTTMESVGFMSAQVP